MKPAETQSESRARMVAWAAALLLFVTLAEAVRRGSTQRFDEWARRQVHAHASPAMTAWMSGLSSLGRPEVLVTLGAVIIILLAVMGMARTAVFFGLVVAGSEILDQLLKLLFHRVRPVAYFGLADPNSYSFPSGHALVSCTFCGMLAALAAARTTSRALRWSYYMAAAAMTGAIGLSRVYLGVHYPSDVLGGYAAALVWIFSVTWWRRLRPLLKRTPPARNT